MEATKCPHCGEELIEKADVCPKCGKTLAADTPSAVDNSDNKKVEPQQPERKDTERKSSGSRPKRRGKKPSETKDKE